MSMPRREFEQFVHLNDPVPEEVCYLLHLDPPYIPEGAEDDPRKWAGHYLGTSDDFPRRGMGEHGTSAGPRILQVQKAVGGTWHLVRTWRGGRAKEKQLKTRAGAEYCPECREHPLPGDSPPCKEARYLSRKERRVRQAVREAREKNPGHGEHEQCECGLSDAKAQAFLAGPEVPPEPMSQAGHLAHIERLEAQWRVAQRQELELEAGLHEREGCHGHGRSGMAAAG